MPSSILLALFADAPLPAGQPAATWTDKEVLIAVGSVIGALIPVVLFVLNFATRSLRAKIWELEAERKKPAKLDLPPDDGKKPLCDIEAQLRDAQQELHKLLALDAEKSDKAASHKQLVEQLQGSLNGLQAKLEDHQEELKSERKRIDKALSKDGQTWNEKVLGNAPEFKPLDGDGRSTPILSVLNLKGGVGKTTIATNLAAALDGMGYKVLVIDLDLQGSLTGLFLSEEKQAELDEAEKLLPDFLASSFGAEFPNLLHYTQPILPDGKSGLVPTTDYLAYAEMNLTIRWLLREGNRDVRFLLRHELHVRKRVTNKYDVILLDCPPVFNVCCVNALAASDYLLVPVMPSKQATDRVPVLLARLKEFRDNVNPALKVMGVVANRTYGSELTNDEKSRLSLLRDVCKDRWGQAVPVFDAFIPQNTGVRRAEDENRPLSEGDTAYCAFVELAKEVESHLPTFCNAPAKKGVLS